MKITVLGAGAWGTALAIILQQNRNQVTLWGHHPGHVSAIRSARENVRHLPGVKLHPELVIEADLAAAVAEAEGLVLSIPSKAFRSVANQLSGFQGVVVSTTKGLEFPQGKTMSEVLLESISGAIPVALSGPSLAAEVARGIPTALVAASSSTAAAAAVQTWFHRPTFRVYTSADLPGVEFGGALKNVIAIAAGVCDGLGYGDNAKAALITRGKAEMQRLGVACGGRPETFSGLSGLGDMTVTCFSRLSRNRTFGERVGRGESVEAILASTISAVEGYPTALSAFELGRRLGVPCPSLTEVYSALYQGKSPRQAVVDLLNRDTKPED